MKNFIRVVLKVAYVALTVMPAFLGVVTGFIIHAYQDGYDWAREFSYRI